MAWRRDTGARGLRPNASSPARWNLLSGMSGLRKVLVIAVATLIALIAAAAALYEPYHYIDIRNPQDVIISGRDFDGERVVIRGRLTQNYSKNAPRFVVAVSGGWLGEIRVDSTDPPCRGWIFGVKENRSAVCTTCMNAHTSLPLPAACPLSNERLMNAWKHAQWSIKD